MTVDDGDDTGTNWDAVIGRALAYLCLHQSEAKAKGLLEQARFLMNLGLKRADAAALLGSTDVSLRVTIGRAQRTAAKATTKPAPGSGEVP